MCPVKATLEIPRAEQETLKPHTVCPVARKLDPDKVGNNKPKAKDKALVKWRWPRTPQTATDTKSRCPEENYNYDLDKRVVWKSSEHWKPPTRISPLLLK
jgi:hypothetical protein